MTRQLRELEVLEVLLAQGAIIPCYRCRIAFTIADVKAKNIQNEHLHEKGLGGPDEPGNRAFSHTDPCHNLVTHGNGATWAGSSRHKNAKTTPKRADKFVVNKIPLDTPTGSPAALERCRRCGNYQDECACAPPARSSAFATARRP